MENEKIILFGTGKLLSKYEELCDNLNIGVLCYADNNRSKWGTCINRKKVISPNELTRFDNRILISCKFESEIKKQLKAIGIEDRILSPYDLIKKDVQNHMSDYEYLKNFRISQTGSENIIIDALDGNGWGGTEVWSYAIAEGLASQGYNAEVIGSADQITQPYRIERLIKRYAFNDMSSWEIINDIVNDLYFKMPLVFINSWTEHVFFACCILKKYFPDYVKIISVSHSDVDSAYEKQAFWQDCFDDIVCVSRNIRKKFHEQYGIKKEKLHYKETFVDFDERFEKKYSKAGEPIRIGCAARLEKLYKRADLIPELIGKLEEQNIKYVFEIAGNGSCLDMIKKFVAENNIGSKVITLGYVEKEEMPEFWKRQDIFINFSEFEGTSLSMLEAMSYGAVPVVTDVSGVNDFIKNRVNGCISKVGDLDDIVKNIKYLCNNREKLPEYGSICREEIRTRCRKSDYIRYIADLCGLNSLVREPALIE